MNTKEEDEDTKTIFCFNCRKEKEFVRKKVINGIRVWTCPDCGETV